MNILKLIKILIIRNFREEKFLNFLSIAGVALGIGLFIGVKVASDRAIASFESDIQGIHTSVNYEILDITGIDFNESIYKDVRTIEDNSFPILKTFGYVPDINETIDIHGIPTVRYTRFLNIPLTERSVIEDFLRNPDGILITDKFSDSRKLYKETRIKALVYDREYTLKVIGVLDTDSIPENTVIMDLGNFQEYFQKIGSLTRINISSDEETVKRMHKILPSHLTVEKKEEVFQNQKALIASFRYNLQFISLIAILVGMFLLYNTIFISVVKRRTEIGIMRGLGADKKTVILLFTIQGMILGFIGSVFGILFGQFAAYFSVFAVEKTISTMYSTISISDYMLTKGDVLMALLLGIIVSIVASLIPSFESSRIRPNEGFKEGSFESKYKRYQKNFSFWGVFCIFSGLCLSYFDYLSMPFEFPLLAYIGILFIIVGFTLISPLYLSSVLKISKKIIETIFRAIGKITIGDIKGNIYRFSVALMCVAISSALIIALLTLIFSMRNSLKVWIDRNIVADIYIKPLSCRSNFCFYPVSEEVINHVKKYPEVEVVDKFRSLQLDFHGKKVIGGFADVSAKRLYSSFYKYDTRQKAIFREMESTQKIGISEYLSIKYGLKKGDSIELNSHKGKVKFVINDIFSSYSTTSGFIYFDRRWLKEYWGLDDATQIGIYMKKGVDVNQFMKKVKEDLSYEYSLEIINNQELRQKVLDIFNKSFAITYAIELISIVVSLIGVIITLLALVFERKREISIIRYLGGSWNQIQHKLLLAAGIIGITGIAFGMIMGPLISVIFINVVNKISFGWEIRFSIPFFYVTIVTFILFLTSIFAGLLPSKVAKKIDPKRFISFE